MVRKSVPDDLPSRTTMHSDPTANTVCLVASGLSAELPPILQTSAPMGAFGTRTSWGSPRLRTPSGPHSRLGAYFHFPVALNCKAMVPVTYSYTAVHRPSGLAGMELHFRSSFLKSGCFMTLPFKAYPR